MEEVIIMMINTKVHVRCTAHQSTESGRWIGECKDLGVAVEADDLDGLRSMFGEALQLLFTDLAEDGELEAYMAARGWESVDDLQDYVPWELIAHCETNGIKQQAV